MRPLIAVLFCLACDRPALPQQPPAPEKISIPGTPLTFEVVALPGEPAKTGAFKIGTREVTWAEFNAYFESKDMATGIDAVTRPTRAISYFGQVGVPAHLQPVLLAFVPPEQDPPGWRMDDKRGTGQVQRGGAGPRVVPASHESPDAF